MFISTIQFEKEPEKEEKELKDRLESLMNDSLIGADGISEIKNIQTRIDILEEEKDYLKWFHNNEPIIEKLFQSMKFFFIEVGEFYELSYDDENHIKFKNYSLHRNFLLKLLREYNYIVEDERSNDGKRIKMIIRYKERSY